MVCNQAAKKERIKTMINTHSLAARHAAAKDKSRYSLTSVCVTDKDTRATDGHIAVVISHDPDLPEDMPQKSVFLDAKLSQSLQTDLRKSDNMARFHDNGNGPVLRSTTKAGSTREDPVTRDECFPDFSLVFRQTSPPAFTISLNAQVLRILCDVAKDFYDRGAPIHPLEFTFYTPEHAVLVRGGLNNNGQALKALIMPVTERDYPDLEV